MSFVALNIYFLRRTNQSSDSFTYVYASEQSGNPPKIAKKCLYGVFMLVSILFFTEEDMINGE